MFSKEEIKKIMALGMIVVMGIIAYHLFDNFSEVLNFLQFGLRVISPIYMGFFIAYVINIPMKSIEKNLFEGLIFKKMKTSRRFKGAKKLIRGCSLLTTVLLLVLFATILFSFAIPQLVSSVEQLVAQIPEYIVVVENFFSSQIKDVTISEDIVTQAVNIWQGFLDSLTKILLSIANSTYNYFAKFLTGIFNAILSIVIAVYMLLSKESIILTLKKMYYAFTPQKYAKGIMKNLNVMNASFENFIRGQMLEAVILGFLCYIGMKIFGFEYALLISVLVGITNVIPLFGPYIGAVPSILLLLMVSPVQALWFVLFVIILQQIESNLIYPRVVGTSMGISGFWILTAVIVGNNLFGIIGILLGIPLFSTMYVIIGDIAETRLKNRKIRI